MAALVLSTLVRLSWAARDELMRHARMHATLLYVCIICVGVCGRLLATTVLYGCVRADIKGPFGFGGKVGTNMS